MKIWGNKTESLFDIWSVEHFVSGVTIGSIVYCIMLAYVFTDLSQEKMQLNRKFKYHYFTIILLLAYIWEVLEFYMEAGYTNNLAITYWFQGVEYWLNRAVTDPLMVALGAWCALKMNSKMAAWSARSFSGMWLALHVFVFPHCMYLQNIIGEAVEHPQTVTIEMTHIIASCTTFIWNIFS